MKDRKDKGSAPIMAAGGVVVRPGDEPLIAVVQPRKGNGWVLPKGKLNKKETALAAAHREVLEEVGREVDAVDFLGTISYDVKERPKVVQFWSMRTLDGPEHPLAPDVKAVRWLPLDRAIARLTHPREQEFLRTVGPGAVAAVQGASHMPATEFVLPPRQSWLDRLIARLLLWWRRMIGGGQAA
jgi:8-oxo-dGTP diphosphatase